jgi:hypothetical protein
MKQKFLPALLPMANGRPAASRTVVVSMVETIGRGGCATSGIGR